MNISHYTISTSKKLAPTTAALVADLHDAPASSLLDTLKRNAPDMIAVAGDLTGHAWTGATTAKGRKAQENALRFLCRAASIAPTFYSLGNHEKALSKENRRRIGDTGAVLLDNDFVPFRGMTVGGISSGFGTKKQGTFAKTPPPDLSFLRRFAACDGFKLLLCHHPEYYPRYVRGLAVDLTLSGHAHGGQWRLFGRGIFAPGQGFLPTYTAGVYENRLIVSRGLGNLSGLPFFPRIGNPPELVFVSILPKN